MTKRGIQNAKIRHAHQASGLDRFPDTCRAVFATIPEDFWFRFTAQELGDIAALLYETYQRGREDPLPDFWRRID